MVNTKTEQNRPNYQNFIVNENQITMINTVYINYHKTRKI